MRRRTVRFDAYEMDRLALSRGLRISDLEIMRRILTRCEWRPGNRGRLATTLLELAEPVGDRETIRRSYSRLVSCGLIIEVEPPSRGQRALIQVPVDLYEELIEVSISAISESPIEADNAANAPLSAGVEEADGGRTMGHLCGTYVANAPSVSPQRWDPGDRVGNRVIGSRETEILAAGVEQRRDQGKSVVCNLSRARVSTKMRSIPDPSVLAAMLQWPRPDKPESERAS